MKQRRRPRRADSGFTLLEIMIVLALIGLIAAVVGKGIYERFLAARIRTARLQVSQVMNLVQQSMLEDTRCRSVAELVAEGALREPPHDPWGTPLALECPSQHGKDPVDIISAGPDKQRDTADDIVSWKP